MIWNEPQGTGDIITPVQQITKARVHLFKALNELDHEPYELYNAIEEAQKAIDTLVALSKQLIRDTLKP